MGASLGLALSGIPSAMADVNVFLTEVPDYQWHAGCFGTATGNLMGYWDRHGFPDFYTGPTAQGVAPLNSAGGNIGIVSLWASQAGIDGRPIDQPGHQDDYWVHYESTAPDPYLTAGRTEHQPDCIGDFIGLNQQKWKNMNGECDGNIDAYSFVYWDLTGQRRMNYTPSEEAGLPAVDIPSGLRAWTQYRGSQAETFSQLADFHPEISTGMGFSFDDLKAEIDAGYPVLLFMQDAGLKYRPLQGMERANPIIHGMLAYGYYIDDEGNNYVRYRTSWASGDLQLSRWSWGNWTPEGTLNLPLRGVIGYHPLPRIVKTERSQGQVTLQWHGPAAQLMDSTAGETINVHQYVIEKTTSLIHPQWTPVTESTWEHQASFSEEPGEAAFYRVTLLPRKPALRNSDQIAWGHSAAIFSKFSPVTNTKNRSNSFR